MVGTYYVQALAVTPLVWLASLQPGFLITAILVVNNLRDIDTDARVGKRTLAVRLGAGGARWEYTLLLAGAYAVPLALFLTAPVLGAFGVFDLLLMLPWLTLPEAIRLRRIVYTASDGPTMNQALAGTAQLSLRFGLLFATGLAAHAF